MSDNRVIPLPDAQYEDEARTNECMHRVYSYLLQLAARKKAANGKTLAGEPSAAGDNPAIEPDA